MDSFVEYIVRRQKKNFNYAVDATTVVVGVTRSVFVRVQHPDRPG